MKNVFLMLFVMMGLALGTNLQAQTTCTPEQIAACKKICDPSQCTPEQIAACKKICSAKSSVASTETKTAKAVKVVNQSPAKKASCNAASTAKAGNQAPLSPVRLIGLDEVEQQKTSCQKPCEAKEAKKVKEG